MTTKAEEQERGPWETESGLIDDVDAWIKNAHFGIKEEYSQVVVETTGGENKGAMILFDLVDENGELLGQQGYSIGTGWEISEDGMTISHPKRKNVVTGTLYGQLQNRVVKELGVDMSEFGLPTEASSWENLGFHWMQQAHKTVGGQDKSGLMPTAFLNKFGEGTEVAEEEEQAKAPVKAAPVAKAPAAKAPAGAGKQNAGEASAIELVKQCGTVKEFILKALKVPEIAQDDALMAKCVDDSASGFYKSHKGK